MRWDRSRCGRACCKRDDAVVVNGAYLLQSECIFRKGANAMAGHDMSNMKM